MPRIYQIFYKFPEKPYYFNVLQTKQSSRQVCVLGLLIAWRLVVVVVVVVASDFVFCLSFFLWTEKVLGLKNTIGFKPVSELRLQ